MDLKSVDRVFRLLPKEERYYTLFDQLMAAVVEGGELLVSFLEGDGDQASRVVELKAVERRADGLAREITLQLGKTFVTPIDREDISELASALDDILDAAYAVVSFAQATRLDEVDEHLRSLGRTLRDCIRELRGAIQHLEDRDGIAEHCGKIHRLEAEADERYIAALGDLFAGDPDPLRVIRLKNLYELIENGVDRCDDIAFTLEGILSKKG